MIGYDIKTSTGGYMEADQRAKYLRIFNGKNKPRIYRSLYKYDPATGGLVNNVETGERIKDIKLLPSPFDDYGPFNSVCEAWSFDAEGLPLERLKYAIAVARNGLHDPLDDPAVIDAYAEYMKGATGGEYDDVIANWQYQMHQELLRKTHGRVNPPPLNRPVIRN